MPAIYAIGETIWDLLFKDDEPVTAKAGGAMLNTSVSLGRLGLPVSLISEYGSDRAGELIDNFLNINGVDTSLVYRYDGGKTAVALAFLNEQNEARYSFYKIYPEKRLEIVLPEFNKGDIVLFGAFFSLMPEVREQLMTFLDKAKSSGAMILYDPNIRSPHKNEISSLRELIFENLQYSDLVRASDEDFNTIFDIGNGNEAYEIVRSNGCDILVYTKSNIGVEIHHPKGMLEVEVPKIKTLSTIGAGDSFNAGLIYELHKLGKNPELLSVSDMQRIVKSGISFGSHVCTHYENYITEKFARMH